MPKILLDPGHGGSDPGAVGNGLKEKDINLRLSNLIKQELINSGFAIIMSRSGDITVDLDDRGAMAKKNNCDAFISVHMNSYNGSAKGHEVWYSCYDACEAQSKALASKINNNISTLGLLNRGVKTREGSGGRNYYSVLRNAEPIPAIIIELAFIDNASDASKLKDDNFIKKSAKLISQGICSFFDKDYVSGKVSDIGKSNDYNKVDKNLKATKSVRTAREFDFDEELPERKLSGVSSANLITKEKYLECSTGFLIFFDNIRVDQFVRNFNVKLSVDGSMNMASIEMIYIPDFYKLYYRNEKTGEFTGVEPGIDNMTNVKIFIKNVFNDKYIMVFDGNIRGKGLTKSAQGSYSISFNAIDYMTWLNRTIVPISLPMDITPGDSLKWTAQGIDISNVPKVVQNKEGVFRGKTLKEFLNSIVDRTLKLNKLYTVQNTVAWWDDVIKRITLMGDISKELIRNKIIDYSITSSATFVNSLYVALNDVVKNLMFEFYQDRDGIIRIKPPFWNEKVLKDHVIDPIMILNFNESIDYSNKYTRLVVTGGIEDYYEDQNDDVIKSMLTPAGVLVGNSSDADDVTWSDFTSTSKSTTTSVVRNTTKTGTWLDNYPITFPYGAKYNDGSMHVGIDHGLPMNTKVYHIGASGTAETYTTKVGYGTYVKVKIKSGKLAGYTLIYGHLSKHLVDHGDEVSDGTVLGLSGSTGNSTGPHLHFEVRDKNNRAVNPDTYFSRYGKDVVTEVQRVGTDKLLYPSQDEQRYGASVYDVNQPLIKFSNSQVLSDETTAGCDALRKYAYFMYNLLGAMTEVATVQLIAMPWLRPGFNVWIDPVGIDKVYYVQSISHFGNAENGVYTTLNLSLGRERINYTSGNKNIFGSMRNDNDNLFISEMEQKTQDFGSTLNNAKEFSNIRERCIDFYKQNHNQVIKSNQSDYFKSFYGTSNSDKKISSGTLSYKDNENVIHFNAWPNPLDKNKNSRSKYNVELKTVLKELGFYTGELNEIFDDETKRAVTDFQRVYKLAIIDGSCGKADKAKLKEEYNKITKQDEVINATGEQGRLTRYIFAEEYNAETIQKQLNSIYSAAPQVIKQRVDKIKKIIANAEQYIKLHYITDYKKK